MIHCDDAYCRGLLKDLQLNLKKNSQSAATVKEIKTDKIFAAKIFTKGQCFKEKNRLLVNTLLIFVTHPFLPF